MAFPIAVNDIAMSRILIIYSTTDGHTLKICERLQQVAQDLGHEVMLMPVQDAGMHDLAEYDKIVIGASIRYGKHNRQVYELVRRHQQALDARPNAFFSVNVVARKPEKRSPDTNPYLKKFLRQIAWKPQNLAVFAGKIEYRRYGLFDRWMIRLIMWITHGPTDPDSNIEFTDWHDVERFGRLISEM
jgi:menaquinone-dependent protoporphyrinogen oxidase